MSKMEVSILLNYYKKQCNMWKNVSDSIPEAVIRIKIIQNRMSELQNKMLTY